MKKRILSLVLGTTLLFSTSTIFANTIDTQYIEDMVDVIKNNYLFEVDKDELTENALKGLFGGLDPYSAYYTKEEYKALTESLTGELEEASIGVRLMEDENNKINIIEVIENNPAEKAGIKRNDTIVSVDDADVESIPLEKVKCLISGKAGSKVTIGIERTGEDEILYFDLTREQVIINPVSYHIIDGKIGYIDINEFNNNSLIGVKTALDKFDGKNVDKVIFDVRNNPGGYLSTVKDMLNMLVAEGPIYCIKDSKGNETTEYSTNKNPKYKLAVLTNKKSASASEIFAGAIQDRKSGLIIGTTTYGKGTVQSIMETNYGGAIKLTVAEYFTANKRKVNGIGITPDILIEDTNEGNEDLVLETAIQNM